MAKAKKPDFAKIVAGMGPNGYLHKALHVPKGKKIPLTKLKAATKSKNSTLAARARTALTVRSWNR